MEKRIIRPNGDLYMTAYTDGDVVEFRDFTDKRITIRFDAKVLDQLLPFLNEANFWRKVTHD